jgi:hypothetical protein
MPRRGARDTTTTDDDDSIASENAAPHRAPPNADAATANQPTQSGGGGLAQVLSSTPRALALFGSEEFDPDAFVNEAFRGLTERGIDNARRDLSALLDGTARGVADAAAAHYPSFLELCEGSEELRDGVRLLRNYVSGASALAAQLRADLKPLHSLTRRVLAAAPPAKGGRGASSLGRRRDDDGDGEDDNDDENDGDEDDDNNDDNDNDDQNAALDPSAGAGAAAAAATAAAAAAAMQGFGGGRLGERARRIERDLTSLLRRLDAAVAQRDVPRALAALAAGADAAAALDRDAGALALDVEDLPAWRYHFEASLASRRRALTRALSRQLEDGGAAGPEARAAARSLASLAGDGAAAAAVLKCHSARLRAAAALQLRAQGSLYTVAGDPDGLEYAGALVQGALDEVGAAADALAAVFGARSAAAAAEFAVWSAREGRACAVLLKRHALALAGGGGYGAAAGAADKEGHEAATAARAGGGGAPPSPAPSAALEPAARALAVSLVFCAVLERSHQVSLGAVFERELGPLVESALRRRLQRAAAEAGRDGAEEGGALVMARLMEERRESSAAGSSAAAPPLRVQLVTAAPLLGGLASKARLLAPLLARAPRLASSLREGSAAAYSSYAHAVLRPLRAHVGHSPEDQAHLAPLLPALLEALAGVADAIGDAVALRGGGGEGGALSASAGGGTAGVDVAKQLDAALAQAYAQAQGAMRAAAKQQQSSGG